MSLLYNERPLVLNVDLAIVLGLNESIVLQQLNYWIAKGEALGVDHEGRRWIYNSLEAWKEQFPFWSTDTIQRALKVLREQGIILVEQLKKKEHNRTNFYTIVADHPLINPAMIEDRKLPPSEDRNLRQSSKAKCGTLSENTTETTTENNPVVPSGTDEGTQENCPTEKIVSMYNATLAHKLPKVILTTQGRQKAVAARWKTNKACQNLEFWKDFFEMVKESDFLMGRKQNRPDQKPFEATFDWLMKPGNFVKVIEGNYANKTQEHYQ